MPIWFYPILGLGVGALGTLIGAGGGFVLVPILLYLFPGEAATRITAISLLAVAANASSGSVAYAFRKQIHWPAALLFSLASAPGIWLGLALEEWVHRVLFERVFGLLMIGIAVFLFIQTLREKRIEAALGRFRLSPKRATMGAGISAGVGAIASFLGIGGGIIHVPLLAEFLGFPLHLATGTSHLILALTTSMAVVGHADAGHYAGLDAFVPPLIAGIVVGAQVGAAASKRVQSKSILKILAVALFFVGLRLAWRFWASG